MINLGKLGFDLGINMAGFVQSLTSAGQSVTSFAAKNTQSFAGARQQFSSLSQQLNTTKGTILKSQEAIHDLVASQGQLTTAIHNERDALDQQSQAYIRQRNEIAKTKAQHLDLIDALDKENAKLTQLRADYAAGTVSRADVTRQVTRRDDARRLVTASDRTLNALQGGLPGIRASVQAHRAEMLRLSAALNTVNEDLERNRRGFAAAQEQAGALEARARRMPGSFGRAMDALNNFTTQTRNTLTRVNTGTESFMRGFERMTRGIRGASPEIARAYNDVYRLRERLIAQEKTIRSAEGDVLAAQARIAARQQDIVAGEARIQRNVASIETGLARLAVMEEKLANMVGVATDAQINAQEKAILEQREAINVEREAAKETEQFLKVRRQLLENAITDEQRSRQYVTSTSEAYKNLKDQLGLATERLKQKRAAAKADAEQSKASKRATDQEGFSLDAVIAKLLGFVNWHWKAGQASRQFASQQRTVLLEIERTTSALGRLGSFVRDTLVVTVGTTLGNVFGSMINNLRTLGGAGASQVKSYEQLSFSINALLAKEYRASDSTVNFADAMKRTQDRTREFTNSLESLGIQSTFTSQELTGVFQGLLTSFGSDAALHITRVLSGWGDATSKTAYDLEGVSTALGQIQAKGKVQLEEINQLRERNVSALDYLAKAYGKTTDEILGMISAGQILAKDAIPAIVNGMRTDFAGAGNAAANTFQGLTSSIMDLSQRALRTVFAPVLERIRPILIAVVDKLTDPNIINNLTRFGEALADRIGSALEFLTNVFPDVIEYVSSLGDSIFDSLGSIAGFAEEAYVWGKDIVDAFLDGMWSKIDSIADVARAIGDELSYWMEPHSPPRMAPELDQWGKKTSDTFFNAMGEQGGDQITALGKRLSGLQGVSIGAGGAATFADSPMAATNTILSYIAELLERLVGSSEERQSGSRGGGSRTPDLPPNATPEQTAEYYRQLNEERLKGSRNRKDASTDEEKEAQQAFDAEIRHAIAVGDTAHAMDLLHEKLSGVEEGSKEYFDTQTKIEQLEQRTARAAQTNAKRRATTDKAAATQAKQDFDAKVAYLTKTGDEAQALSLLEQRLGQVREGSKEYYAILTKIDKLKKGEGDGTGIPFEGMDTQRRPQPGRTKDDDTGPSRFQMLLARVRAQADAVRQRLAPITSWIRDHQREIGFLLTTVAIRIARAFVVTRVMPLLREFAVVMGLVGRAGLRMLTPLNLLKIAINLLAVAWVKDIGGIREIAADMFRDIAPEIRGLLNIFGEVFGPGNAGIGAKLTAFQTRLPEIRARLKALFDRIGQAFVDWMGPLSGQMRARLEIALQSFLTWVRQRGGGMFIDYLKRLFDDVQRWMEGQDPNTFIVGVIAKLTATIATVSQVMIVGLVTTIGALIISYGPQISKALQKWGDRLTDWIDTNTPTVLTGLANFVGIVGLGLLSGAIELARYLGKWTLLLSGWIIPGIPKAISVLLDFVFAIGQWFLNVGAAQLAGMLGDFVATALERMETSLPAFGLELGRMLGRFVTQALALVASALFNVYWWGPQLHDFFVNRLLPAAGRALRGLARGLIALVGGVLIGLLDPIADTIRLGIWVRKVLDWAKSFGIDFVNQFIDGLGLEIPSVVTYLLGWFDTVVSQFKVFLGIANRADRVRAVTAGFRRDLQRMPNELRPFAAMVNSQTIPAIAGLGATLLTTAAVMRGWVSAGSTVVPWLNRLISAWRAGRGAGGGLISMLRSGVGALANFGRTLITQTIPAMARTAGIIGALLVQRFTSLVLVINTAVIGALRRLGVALITLASTQLRGTFGIVIALLIQRLGDFVIAIRTATIPAILDMGKALIVNAIKALVSFISTIVTGGIPALIALARQGIAAAVTGLGSMVAGLNVTRAALVSFATSALAIAAIGVAIALVVQKFNQFKQTVADAAQTMLNGKTWWNQSAEALQRYADASENVRLATLDQAETVKGLRDEIESDTKAMIEHSAAFEQFGVASGNTRESLDAEMRAIQAKRDRLKNATRELNTAVDSESRQNAMLRASTEAYGQYKRQVANTGEELDRMVDKVNEVTSAGTDALAEMVGTTNTYLKDREGSWKEHTDALTSLQAEFNRATTDDEKAAIQERINEEQKGFQQREAQAAIEYVKQRQEQRRHLGQMLIDYIQSQAALNKYDETKTAALVDNVAQQYGVQQSVSEKTFLKMRGDIDQFFRSASGNLDGVTKALETNADQLQTNQALVDKLTEQHTMEIIQTFQKRGKYDPAELAAALDKVPELVEVEIKTTLNDKTGIFVPTAEQQQQLRDTARRFGAKIADEVNAGMIAGMQANRTTTANAGAQTGQAVTTATENKLGIRSPSTVFRKMGHFSMEGLKLGFKDRIQDVLNTQSGLMGALGNIRPRTPQLAMGTAALSQGGRGGNGFSISMPINITGNTVRSDDDLHALKQLVMTDVVNALDTIVVQGLKQ